MSSQPKFEILVDRYSSEIFSYLYRMVADRADAEDCLQESFLRAFRAYPRLAVESNHRAWLYAIATNVARTFLRRRNRRSSRRQKVDPDLLPGSNFTLMSVERRERLRQVFAAVERLPEKQRAALLMRKYQNLSYRDIAEALGCSRDAARANVYQALKRLRAQFHPAVTEEG